jgi:hypothetical protein
MFMSFYSLTFGVNILIKSGGVAQITLKWIYALGGEGQPLSLVLYGGYPAESPSGGGNVMGTSREIRQIAFAAGP